MYSRSDPLIKKLKPVLPIVAIVSIIITILIGFMVFSATPVTIQRHDEVKIDYTVWESDEYRNYNPLTPLLDTILWVTMIPITENSTSGLVLGLYNTLLGKELFYESGLVWLNRCIDQDRDGIDDVTGKPALTYGNSTDLYFNTCLMIQLTVLDIQKSAGSTSIPREFAYIIFIIAAIAGLIIGGRYLLIPGVYKLHNYFKTRKTKEKIKKFKEPRYTRKEFALKFGILAFSLSIISLIILGTININYPLGDLSYLMEYYPEIIPIMILLIIAMWSCFIPLYLVLYGFIKRRNIKS